MGGVSMEWKEVRLGDIVSIKSGLAYKGAFIGKGENILLGMGCVSFKDKFLFSGARPYEADCDDKYCVEPGDIVLATRQQSDNLPILAMPAIIPSSLKAKKIIYGTNLYKVENHSEVTNDFLFWQLKTPDYIDYISSVKTGSVVRMVTKKNVEDYVFRCPPKEVRDRISKLLWGLDRKIELNNKINADLEEMAQAIFKNWFVDFEPFKDGKFVDSELGMIPEGWKVGCLGDLITIKYGKDHKKLDDGTFPVYGSGGFMRFVNSWLYNGESVLIPRKGTLDNIMYVCEKFWTVDTMFFSVPKMDYVMKYVYNYIKRFDFSKMNEGTSVPSNTAARLNKMPILIPTHEILEMYDETLCPIYNKRKMKDKESRTLSLLRDTLLPRLMSGELEVPE